MMHKADNHLTTPSTIFVGLATAKLPKAVSYVSSVRKVRIIIGNLIGNILLLIEGNTLTELHRRRKRTGTPALN
jgi:hypothetical protein